MKSKFYILTLCILFSSINLSVAQDKNKLENKTNSFYAYWGYNRSMFSTSNLHFNGPDYDFTVYDITASDRPSKFGWTYFNPSTITIPQYNLRVGYFFTDRFSLSFGIDHMKYVVDQNQKTLISGIITSNASPEYAGTYLNESIILDADLLKFEHTDGFNLVTFDLEYLYPFRKWSTKNLSFFWNVGFGGIWVATKTNVKVLGDGLDNDFHVAGFSISGKTGPRIEFRNWIFLMSEIRTGYASLPSVLIKNNSPELGDHNLTYIEYYIAIGVNWKFEKNKH